MTTNDMKVNEVLTDPSTSGWLRRALLESTNRDPVDMMNDLETLVSLVSERLPKYEPKDSDPGDSDFEGRLSPEWNPVEGGRYGRSDY